MKNQYKEYLIWCKWSGEPFNCIQFRLKMDGEWVYNLGLLVHNKEESDCNNAFDFLEGILRGKESGECSDEEKFLRFMSLVPDNYDSGIYFRNLKATCRRKKINKVLGKKS